MLRRGGRLGFFFFVLFFLRRCFDAAAVKSGASAALPTTLAKRTLGLAKCGKRRLGKKKKTVTLHLGQKTHFVSHYRRQAGE